MLDSHPEEQPACSSIFRASGLRDNQTLANFAVVSFDPKTDGTVTSVHDRRRCRPSGPSRCRVQDLSKALEEPKRPTRTFSERKKAYQDSHMEAIDRVLKAQGAGQEAHGRRRHGSGRVGEVARRHERVGSQEGVRRARTRCQNARPIAELSLVDAERSRRPILPT